MSDLGALLRAFPYRGFGATIHPGKVHLLKDGNERTYCGKTLQNCPGEVYYSVLTEVDCKSCNSALESEAHRAVWIQENAKREVERLERSQQWHSAYEEYLQSPTWYEKRRKVMRRCHSICEGCGDRKATQVHHKCYPYNLVPGTEEWNKSEKLFDLVAVCDQCHSDLHQ